MSGSSKTSRWLLVILVVAILAVLVWQLTPENLFFVSLAIAIVLALILGTSILRWRSPSRPAAPAQSPGGQEDEMASDPGLETEDYRNAQERIEGYRESKPRLPATEVVARYLEMAEQAKAAEEKPFSTPLAARPSVVAEAEVVEEVAQPAPGPEAEKQLQPVATGAEEKIDNPPIPLILDESTLAEEDKIQLENAVWYRCENPYCKYTHFLEVHHIMDEKDGGNNKLDNLIVLCPFCHELAHKGDIPEKEMRDWIAQRDARFNAKLNWRY